jgi:Uma2 family endonuclease
LPTLEEILMSADEQGFRLELVHGLGIWEAQPALRHQTTVDRVRSTIHRGTEEGSDCACFHVADVYVLFPDGSFKRPDVSVFCREPEEQETAITLIPEAVIEIISKGNEAKDLQFGATFYIENGVKDAVIFNPYTNEVRHFTRRGLSVLSSPADLVFECGCRCTV